VVASESSGEGPLNKAWEADGPEAVAEVNLDKVEGVEMGKRKEVVEVGERKGWWRWKEDIVWS
jgi:hypothetical protein